MTDREIADLLHEVHRNAGARIPFARVLAGARARAGARNWNATLATRLASTAAAVLVLAVAIASVSAPPVPHAEQPRERWKAPTDFLLAGNEFSSPTDFLLETPGLEPKGALE